jgi:hypothetical protein
MAGAVTCSDHYYTTEKKNEVAVSFFLPHRIVSQSLPFFSFSFFFLRFLSTVAREWVPPSHATPHRDLLFFFGEGRS